MPSSNLRSKTSKSLTQSRKFRNQNFEIDPPGYIPVASYFCERCKEGIHLGRQIVYSATCSVNFGGQIQTGHWKVTGRIDFKILISNFWPPGEGFQGFRPQIRLQHAKISMLTSFEVNWLQLKRFPKFCPVAFQYPVPKTSPANIQITPKSAQEMFGKILDTSRILFKGELRCKRLCLKTFSLFLLFFNSPLKEN